MRSASWAHFRSGTNTKTKDIDLLLYSSPKHTNKQTIPSTPFPPKKPKTTSSGSGSQT